MISSRCPFCVPNWTIHDSLPPTLVSFGGLCVFLRGVDTPPDPHPSPPGALQDPHSPRGTLATTDSPAASGSGSGCGLCGGHLPAVSCSCSQDRAHPWGQTWPVSVPLSTQLTFPSLPLQRSLLCCLLFPQEQAREPCDFQAAAWQRGASGSLLCSGEQHFITDGLSNDLCMVVMKSGPTYYDFSYFNKVFMILL